MPDRAKRSGSQDAKVQTIRGRPANLKQGCPKFFDSLMSEGVKQVREAGRPASASLSCSACRDSCVVAATFNFCVC